MALKENRFYVYLHRKRTDGSIFYVGKGQGTRAYNRAGRNKGWKSVESNNGRTIDFVVKNVKEDYALFLESVLISKFRSEGIELVNVSDYGNSQEGKTAHNRKPVICSNGMKFDCVHHAKDWVRSEGHNRATVSAISWCADGRYNSMYGYAWWWEGDEPKEYVPPAVGRDDFKKKSVRCIDNGMIFDSIQEAAIWVGHGRVASTSSKIGMCCNGLRGSAYKHRWEFV